MSLTFGGSDGVQGLNTRDKEPTFGGYGATTIPGRADSASVSSVASSRRRNGSDSSKARVRQSRHASRNRSFASKLSQNRSASGFFSEKTQIDEETDERIKVLRMDHAKVKGELDEEFKHVNVKGLKRDFDPGPVEGDLSTEDQSGEKIFTLAGKVAKAKVPMSSLRNSEKPRNAAASFLAEDDDEYEGLRGPDNSCWICGDSEQKGKFKDCDFCGHSSCQACVKTLRRFPRQMIIPNTSDEPARSPCCDVCVSKLFMGELYLGLPQNEDDPKESLRSKIAKKEEKLSGRHGDLRQRHRELAGLHKANLQFTDEMNSEETKFKEKEKRTEKEIQTKELELSKLRLKGLEKETEKAQLQKQLEQLRKEEGRQDERNQTLQRNIDDQKKWNEQLRNEYDCLHEAIKNEIAMQQAPAHCPSYESQAMQEKEVDNMLTTRESGYKSNVPVTLTNNNRSNDGGQPRFYDDQRQSGESNIPKYVDKSSAITDPRSSRNGSRIEQSKQTVMTEDQCPTDHSHHSPQDDSRNARRKQREIPNQASGKKKNPKRRGVGGPDTEPAKAGGCCAGDQACLIF